MVLVYKSSQRFNEAVVTGCSSVYESNIGWWLSCLREHNSDLKIIFYDFGLSEAAKHYLDKQRNVHLKTGIFDDQKFSWDFKQRACIDASKYTEKILWLDQDCEVLGDLKKIFSKARTFNDFVISKDIDPLYYPNSTKCFRNQRQAGVFCCFAKHPILIKWIEAQETHLNDQVAISSLLDSRVLSISEIVLAYDYHWPRLFVKTFLEKGCDLPTVIHWTGKAGQQIIQRRKEDRETTRGHECLERL